MTERSRAALAGLAIGAAALATLAFALAVPAREAVPAWLGLLAGSGALLGLGGWTLHRAGAGVRWTRWVIGGALALRLAALAAPVSLSDDVHRYLWDGTLLVEGEDPYATRPREVVGAHGLSEAWLGRLNSPSYYTVYPPLAQLAFGAAALASRVPGIDGTLALRALFVAAELGAVWLLVALVARLERPRWWALLYAWNPLVVWEVAAGGHTEALMLPLLLASVLALLADRPARAGLLLGLAASAKLSVLAIAPVMLVFVVRRIGARRALPLAVTSAAALALGYVPFASPSLPSHVGESLALYRDVFSFNAPIYYAARHLLGYREGLTASVDGTLMPWLALASVAWIGLSALAQNGDPRRLALGLAYAWLGALLLSRVVHPWYLLPPLALGVIGGSRSIALLSALVALSYLRYDPLGAESPLVIALEYAPFAASAAHELARARRASGIAAPAPRTA